MNAIRHAGVILLTVVTPALGLSHDRPDAVIARLSATIAAEGPTADRLFRRGCEYRSLRKYRSAAADFQHALQLDPASDLTRLEWVRLQWKQIQKVLVAAGDESGLNTATSGLLQRIQPLLFSEEEAVRTAGHALRGEIFLATERWQFAVVEFDVALENHPHEVQWYLWRAEAEQKLGRPTAAIAGLRQAATATDSPVVHAALCDALLQYAAADSNPNAVVDSEPLREALAMSDQQLRRCRLKSAWRIRKAEGLLLQGETAEAKTQLTAAIAELDSRLQTPRPDPSLVLDRAKAIRLLPN